MLTSTRSCSRPLLASTEVVASYDFLNQDEVVSPELGDADGGIVVIQIEAPDAAFAGTGGILRTAVGMAVLIDHEEVLAGFHVVGGEGGVSAPVK